MDRTSPVLVPQQATARPSGPDAAPRPYAELTNGPWSFTPIYGRLVREWRERGRTVPRHPDVQWVSFAGLPARQKRDAGQPEEP